MKKIIFLLCSLYIHASYSLDISIESVWENLETPQETSLFGSQWVLAAIITFKRNPSVKDIPNLTKLTFSWHGPYINKLTASLYKKDQNQTFIPVEEALICDGKWNKNTQELYFKFDEEQKIDPMTRFYIVITIPDHLIESLQDGSFALVTDTLPDAIKEYLNVGKHNTLSNNVTSNNTLYTLGLSFTVCPFSKRTLSKVS